MTTPANPDDLTSWLRAQLDDDERVARAAGGGMWTRECGHIGMEDEDLPPGHDLCAVVAGDIHIYDEGGHTPNQAEHIARHDPARVLADVDAKRRIMAIHHPRKFEGMGGLPQICDGCGYEGICDDPVTEDINDCPILRLLALPFAGREGFREEWRA